MLGNDGAIWDGMGQGGLTAGTQRYIHLTSLGHLQHEAFVLFCNTSFTASACGPCIIIISFVCTNLGGNISFVWIKMYEARASHDKMACYVILFDVIRHEAKYFLQKKY